MTPSTGSIRFSRPGRSRNASSAGLKVSERGFRGKPWQLTAKPNAVRVTGTRTCKYIVTAPAGENRLLLGQFKRLVKDRRPCQKQPTQRRYGGDYHRDQGGVHKGNALLSEQFTPGSGNIRQSGQKPLGRGEPMPLGARRDLPGRREPGTNRSQRREPMHHPGTGSKSHPPRTSQQTLYQRPGQTRRLGQRIPRKNPQNLNALPSDGS